MRNRILLVVVCLLLFAAQTYANTVTVDFLNTSSAPKISGLQFDFIGSNPGVDLPLDMNWDTFLGDFTVTFGDAVNVPAGWNADTLIKTQGNSDYVRGMSFSTKAMNPSLAPGDGVFVTMESFNTDFAIDLDSFIFFDFTGPYGEIINSPFSVVQTSDSSGSHVLVDFAPSAVPIPGAVWLLGSGLIGLVALGRKKRQ